MANALDSCFLLWNLATALLLLSLKSYSQPEYGGLSIDCGEDSTYMDENHIIWYTDFEYIKQATGYKYQINKTLTENPMNTLRIFPNLRKNCYTLPAFIQQKYLLRAGFYYGNYDNASRPPTFDLFFDANTWMTVVTSSDQPVFYEAVVTAKRHNISVCVARTRNDSTPFISSLEIMQLLPGMYSGMKVDHALFKQYRVNFGSNGTSRFPDDIYGRLWEPAPQNQYPNLTANFRTLLSSVPDDPPSTVIATAIQAPLPNDSITLSFETQKKDRPIYFILYFAELQRLEPTQKRIFEIYINGQDYNLKVSPVYQVCNEIHGNASLVSGPLTVMLAPSAGSNMPPIVNAMELYAVSETLSNGTSPEDLMGLELVIDPLSSLTQWSGDPCLPISWEWLRCNLEDPPRVTELHLANLHLQFLRNFSIMQSLEIIDLQNNSLYGSVPDFLGNFPKLKELNLADNDLRGEVLESLLNRNIALNIKGTQLTIPVQKSKKSHTRLIVGLIVGFVALVLGCLLIAFIRHRSQGDRKVVTVELAETQSGHQDQANLARSNEHGGEEQEAPEMPALRA